jgi:hypothetical protein
MARLVVPALVLAALLAGCGGSTPTVSQEGPGAFVTRILREEISGQWSRQWRDLHPAHQRLITQSQYVVCSRRMGTDFATGDEVFKVIDVKDEPIKVKDVPQRTSKVVAITLREPGSDTIPTYHLHAVSVSGRWTWILGGRFLSALARGQCLDGSPLPTTA